MRVARRPRCLGDEAPSVSAHGGTVLREAVGVLKRPGAVFFLSGYMAYVATGEAGKKARKVGNEGEIEWISSVCQLRLRGGTAHRPLLRPTRATKYLRKKGRLRKFSLFYKPIYFFSNGLGTVFFSTKSIFRFFYVESMCRFTHRFFDYWFCRTLADLCIEIFRNYVSYFRIFSM